MRRTRKLAAVVAAAALMAAACGGGDDGGGTTAGTVDEGVKEGVSQALGGSTTTGAAPAARPTSMDQWEALWAQERAAIVAKMKQNKWGTSADGKTITGPEGFTVDLTKCPAGWSNTEGLTDTSIKIGHTTALSGVAADYGNISKTLDIVFQYYSQKGAFKDSLGKTRSVNLITKDDGYDAARTIPLVDELIDSEKVFAMWTLGSPPGLKNYDKLNQRCIPHPFEMSGHPAWGDPVNHPWTTGFQLAYGTEAALWGAFIEQRQAELPDKIKVASLVANNDFGRAYDAGFEAYLAQSPLKDKVEYFKEVVEITAPTVKDPMTTIASRKPDVFITMTGATQCPQIILESAENGMKEDTTFLFMSSVCKGASFVGKDKVGGDGSASNGWWIIGGGAVDFNSPGEDNNPFVQWGRQLLASKGLDYKSSGSLGSGFGFAFPMVQALQMAGELDGGLTRSNFLAVQRAFEMTSPMALPGIKINTNGNKDAFFTEGSDISKYDSAKQQWIQQGEVIDISGKSRNCVFDQATSTCK